MADWKRVSELLSGNVGCFRSVIEINGIEELVRKMDMRDFYLKFTHDTLDSPECWDIRESEDGTHYENSFRWKAYEVTVFWKKKEDMRWNCPEYMGISET